MQRVHPATYLFAARALREFGDGFVAVLLPAYLLALRLSAFEVGIIATVSLIGSSLLTMAVGFLGAKYDHRQLLLAAASLMVATGVAFSVVHDYALLLVVALAGTVNPSSGSVSVFAPLEHAVLAREVDAERTKMFAHYSLVGALAGPVGALAAATPDLLSPSAGLDQLMAIKTMFVLYSILGNRRPVLRAHSTTPPPVGFGRRPGPRAVSAYRLQARSSVQSGCSCRRLCRAVVTGAVAIRAFRPVACSRQCVLFLVRRVLCVLISGRGVDVERIGLINTMVFTHIPSSVR